MLEPERRSIALKSGISSLLGRNDRGVRQVLLAVPDLAKITITQYIGGGRG